jgi:hypothetical protein
MTARSEAFWLEQGLRVYEHGYEHEFRVPAVLITAMMTSSGHTHLNMYVPGSTLLRNKQAITAHSDPLHVLKVHRGQGFATTQDRHDVPHAQLFETSVGLDGTPGIVARQQGFRASESLEPGMNVRLIIVDVEGNTTEDTGIQGVSEGVLIDKGPAGNVDET